MTTPLPPRNPAGHSPLRRARSMRRTSSIDISWPDGTAAPAHYVGRCRDIYTASAGGPVQVLAEEAFDATVTVDGTIVAIATTPARAAAQQLVGQGRGSNLRRTIESLFDAERRAGSPIYLLLDDLPACILISLWPLQHWDNGRHMPKGFLFDDPTEAVSRRAAMMEGVCIGFAPGSSGLLDTHGKTQNYHAVPPMPRADDPDGFHTLPANPHVSMRRARRIDVWRDDLIHVDATFQDSANLLQTERVAVHEYLLNVTADPATLKILSIEADPRILPYRECPSAPDNLGRLIGLRLDALRSEVPRELRRTLGCTHLNDALRALAEVPALLAHLQPVAAGSS